MVSVFTGYLALYHLPFDTTPAPLSPHSFWLFAWGVETLRLCEQELFCLVPACHPQTTKKEIAKELVSKP